MIDPRKLGQLLLGEWNKTGQQLKERGSVLPIGEYEDGSVGLAWPALLNTPYEALRNFGSHGYGEDAVPYNARQAFDAAGLAMTGGLGVGLAGGMVDNALGSAGGKLTQSASDLPMDLASRMARAREMGFDLPAYHATGADFDQFNPGYRGASFFADSPSAAERGASAGSADWYGMRSEGADRIMPVMLRSEYIKGLNLTPDEKAWWQALPDTTTDEGFIEGLNYPSYKLKNWWQAYDETPNADGTFTYTKKPMPSKTLDDVRQTGTDVYGDKYIGSWEGEQGAARLAREAGMDGFILEDEAGISIGIADPRRIRSVNAAFDPSKADSANLLAANAKTGAAVPLAMQAQQDSDINPALLDYLRLTGLY